MIAVIDYQSGNISSILNTLQKLKVPFIVTNKIKELEKAEKIIFPGVGHAKFAMQKLKEFKLIEFIKNTKQPFFGVCLGMQLLFSFSEEGDTPLLDVVPGKVKKFKSNKEKIPHMGWNNISYTKKSNLFKDIPPEQYFYFVHSFYAEISDFTTSETNYINNFSASFEKDNFYGVQFHPEKSGNIGLNIFRNFINL